MWTCLKWTRRYVVGFCLELSKLKKFEAELRTLPYNLKSKYQPAIKTCRSWHDNAKVEFSQIRAKKIANAASMDDIRARLLESDAAIIDMDQSLASSKRIVAESEEVGRDTAETLLSQRKQLENAKNSLYEIDETSDRSKSLLRSMAARVMTDKLLQGFIILLEIGIAGIIVYVKYYKD